MSDINLNLHTTTGAMHANAKPATPSTHEAAGAQAAAPAETKNVSSNEISNYMQNNPATLAAIAGINFTTPAASTGAKVATAAGETVFGEDVAAMISSNLKYEHYQELVDNTPPESKARIAESMVVLDNEI